ncbi:CFEM domain-containing protein [Fusarium keratoplasticum]|uniref:CFEM domain-containing protein n=1 Tax=Fusarium keratoplasticum TaxID=1328300 RepID=A0ACC0R873_9HYPO|nr:CFEM domain-containing protein [Fusarium keratoplasticum]KAI8675937.1 CFEM domain-containing protein [Fusarium keratoplasticum]
MKRVYALSFIFLDAVFGQRARAAMPGSVVDCLRSTTFGCGSGDIDCLCSASKRKEHIAEFSSCIKKGCKPDEVVSAEDSYGPLYVRAEGPKIGPEGSSSTTAGANAPVNPAGQGAPAVESSATAKEVMETSSIEVDISTEEVVSTEVHWQDVGTKSTDDTATSTSTDPVKAGIAASASTARAVSETTASMSTESSTASSASTEEEQATDTVLPASDKYYPRGGLSAGAKAGIGVGIALGVIGLACLVAAIWLIRRKRAATGASGMGVTHAQSVKSPNPFSRQVEVAEIDGRPAPQELPA